MYKLKIAIWFCVLTFAVTGCRNTTDAAMEDTSTCSSFQTSSNNTEEPPVSELSEPKDEDGTYLGELAGYVKDCTGELMESETEGYTEEITSVCKSFAESMFNMSSDTEDFTESLLTYTHEQYHYPERLKNIYPLFQTIHMESELIDFLPHYYMFFRDDSGNLYCKFIGSPVYECKTDFLDKGKYANPIEFDMVFDGEKWKILNTSFQCTVIYDENYHMTFDEGSKGTRYTFGGNERLFTWAFGDINAFVQQMTGSDEDSTEGENYDHYSIEKK